MTNGLLACVIVSGVIAATFLPFVAGGYDPLAVPLSGMAWVLGRVGLLLVPIGGLWLWASARQASRPAPPPGWCGSRSAHASSLRW